MKRWYLLSRFFWRRISSHSKDDIVGDDPENWAKPTVGDLTEPFEWGGLFFGIVLNGDLVSDRRMKGFVLHGDRQTDD